MSRLAMMLTVVGLILTPSVWLSGGEHRAWWTAAVGLMFLALPAWAAWTLLTRRIVVHRDRVAVLRGERVVRELAFADLTEVRPGMDGSSGAATPEMFNKSVTLQGRTLEGRRRGLKVSALTVESIDPLLRALAPEVARRPELLTRDLYRDLFAEFIDDAGSDQSRQRG